MKFKEGDLEAEVNLSRTHFVGNLPINTCFIVKDLLDDAQEYKRDGAELELGDIWFFTGKKFPGEAEFNDESTYAQVRNAKEFSLITIKCSMRVYYVSVNSAMKMRMIPFTT